MIPVSTVKERCTISKRGNNNPLRLIKSDANSWELLRISVSILVFIRSVTIVLRQFAVVAAICRGV